MKISEKKRKNLVEALPRRLTKRTKNAWDTIIYCSYTDIQFFYIFGVFMATELFSSIDLSCFIVQLL